MTHPTSYPDINITLHALRSGVQDVLGINLIGIYVHGSLASGDFDPQRSDIDFVVVTYDEFPDAMLQALESMHTHITTSGLKWATKLEGSYIPQNALRCYYTSHTQHPSLRVDGSFGVDQHGVDWVIQRHIIREKGVVLTGPAPKTLIDPVQPKDLKLAVLGTLSEWWSPQLHDPARLYSSEYQAYAILTMCRVLYTLQHGIIVSKPIAARWAQHALRGSWEVLIEQALAWRHDTHMDALNETLEFIRYTLVRGQQFKALAEEA